jgi:TolB protein
VGHPDEAQGRRYTTTGSDSLEVDQPTLTIIKVGTPATVRAGGTLTYTITVTNTGDPEIDAYSVTVTDTLPNVLTLITASASQGACEVNGQNLTCTLGTLPRGASATITLEAQVALSAPAGMSIVNQAFVTSAEGAQAQAEAVNTVVSFTEAALCEVGCPDVQVYHSNRTGNWEIFRVGGPVSPDVQDTNRNLTQNPADDREPSLSQDGRWMAFSSNRDGNWEIYVMPTDGSIGQAQRVTYNTIAVDADPAWGPTDYLVYASTRDGNWELYLLDLRTGVETRLTNNDADDLNPFWSPDGSRIVFQSNRSGRWQLYELNLMTAAVRLLSDGSADDLDAAYSHDGSRIALRSLTTDGAVIMTMNANGSGRRVISEASASAANPVWSPDDRLIAYQSDLDGDLDIYIYEVASAQTRQLTDNAVDDYAPTWLCDARRVVFTSDTPGNPDIFRAEALPIDAAAIDVLDQAVRLTNHPAVDIYPEGAPNEENATLEGRLPDSQRAEVAHTALILPNVRATAPDTTLARGEAWRAVLGCAGTAFTQPPYQLGALPAR